MQMKSLKPSSLVGLKPFRTYSAIALAVGLVSPGVTLAQPVAPSQVLPRPNPIPPKGELELEQSEPAPASPAFARDDSLAVELGEVRIEGAFAEMAEANAAFIKKTAHQRLTLSQLLGAAQELEQTYARRGYILVRINVPPQRIEPGAEVRVVVTDGFIEDIELKQIPRSLRAAIKARVKSLIGRHHLTQAVIERALLLAGDLPGAELRSAVAPGKTEGGAHLVIEGKFHRINVQLTTDNNLPSSLGVWQFNANLALNGPLGIGDQLYVVAGSQADIGRYGFPRGALGLIGGGYSLPLGRQGLILTGEFLNSRTQPNPEAGVALSVGQFTREAIRLRFPAIRTRSETLGLTGSLELLTQSEKLPQFGFDATRDHYLVGRFAADWQRYLGQSPLAISATLSRAIYGRIGTTRLPNSRSDTVGRFVTLEGIFDLALPGPGGFWLNLTARGKTGFGKPLYLSEQFSLDAANGVSAFPSGSFNVDSGASLRAELRYPPLAVGRKLTLAPYLFGAKGRGTLARPTAVEQRLYSAGSAGFGTRVNLDSVAWLKLSGASVGVELGHQFSNIKRRGNANRVSFSAALKF